jgi:predicted nucleic acid-binding protein
MPYLIDSDILIDISRGKQAAHEYVDALTEGWAISQVSALELIVGARHKRDLANIDTFLSAYVIVPLRDSTGRRAYELLKL